MGAVMLQKPGVSAGRVGRVQPVCNFTLLPHYFAQIKRSKSKSSSGKVIQVSTMNFFSSYPLLEIKCLPFIQVLAVMSITTHFCLLVLCTKAFFVYC